MNVSYLPSKCGMGRWPVPAEPQQPGRELPQRPSSRRHSSSRRALCSRRHGERGNALIELCLLLPILLALFLGTWSVGYSCFLYSELEAAVVAGAKYGAKINYDATNPSSYTTAVQNVVVYGDPGGGTAPVISGLQTSNVNVSISPTTGQPASVTVSVSNFKVFGPWLNAITLSNKPWIQIPFIGNYLPS